ncbi:MAG: hypothetical protein WDO17_14545 [Alphaproteobacteria bacterium]
MSPTGKYLALFVGFGTLGIVTFGMPAQAAGPQWQCMTDDGYGRKLPCDMGYKAANPNWKATNACHTKGKGGKVTPCTDAQKASFTK